MKPLSLARAYIEVIVLIVIAVLMMTDIDGAHAAPVSDKYESLAAAEAANLDPLNEYTFSKHLVEPNGLITSQVCTYELSGGDGQVWYDDQQLCVNADTDDKNAVVIATNKKLNKSKDFNIKIQYNLNNGQTLTREYTAKAKGAGLTYFVLSSEQDVTEFMALLPRTSYVIVTYKANSRYAYMLVFKLVLGRFSM